MDDNTTLRRAIEALATNHYRRRYPPELRARIAAHARSELGKGRPLGKVAGALGMGSKTLERFLEEVRPPALMPVQVIAPGVEDGARPDIVVRGGCGVSIDGLDLEGVAELLWLLA